MMEEEEEEEEAADWLSVSAGDHLNRSLALGPLPLGPLP